MSRPGKWTNLPDGKAHGKISENGKSIGTELDRQTGVKNLPWNLPAKLVRGLEFFLPATDMIRTVPSFVRTKVEVKEKMVS